MKSKQILGTTTALLLMALTTDALAGQVIYNQAAITNIDNNFLVAPSSVPAGQLNLIQWTPNPNSSSGDMPISWSMASLTGVTAPSPLATYERGVSTVSGTTAVEAFGGTIGFIIDSDSLKVPNQSNGSLFPIVAHYDFPAAAQFAPFSVAGHTLVYAIEAQIPMAVADNSTSYAYATLYFDVVDQVSGLHFWYGSQLYDKRGTSVAYENIFYDGNTNQAIVSSVMNLNGQFSTKFSTSKNYQSATWTGFRDFQFAITANNFSNAIQAVKTRFPSQYAALSNNPSNYLVTHFNFNPEIAYFGGSGKIGVSFKNIRISVQDASDCKNTYNGVNGAVGLTNGDTRYLCSNTTWYSCGAAKAAWNIHATNGQVVSGLHCDLTHSQWVP